MRVLRIIAKAAVAFYEELFFHAIVGLAHLVCWLLVIPGPFALAGIYNKLWPIKNGIKAVRLLVT